MITLLDIMAKHNLTSIPKYRDQVKLGIRAEIEQYSKGWYVAQDPDTGGIKEMRVMTDTDIAKMPPHMKVEASKAAQILREHFDTKLGDVHVKDISQSDNDKGELLPLTFPQKIFEPFKKIIERIGHKDAPTSVINPTGKDDTISNRYIETFPIKAGLTVIGLFILIFYILKRGNKK